VNFPNGTTEHPINKSGKRKILVSVWDFEAVHPQSERSYYVCNDHPAKMRPALAKAILQLYGERPVLDPMAGIGTTLVEAMLLGMDAVGVEFEKKFVDQANKNISHVTKLFSNKNLGKAFCIKGDARDLSRLSARKVSSVVFSPPYFNAIESVSTGHQEPKGGHLETQHKLAKEGKSGYGDKYNIEHFDKYGSIVFSPPYFDALSISKGGGSKSSILCKESARESQIERSRPFAVKKNLPTPYSSEDKNIGNLSSFGTILFSPPYCGVMDARRHVGGISTRDLSLAKTGSYSTNEKNIGNISNERTYLGEMVKVYSECHRVLKSGKFMVVVVKDIMRRGLTIPLGADTIKLCQLAGFEVFDVIINKMYFPSFWVLDRAIKYQQKGILHPLKTHEYVLVFRKPSK